MSLDGVIHGMTHVKDAVAFGGGITTVRSHLLRDHSNLPSSIFNEAQVQLPEDHQFFLPHSNLAFHMLTTSSKNLLHLFY